MPNGNTVKHGWILLLFVSLYITKRSEAVLQWGKRKNIKKMMINGELVIEWKKEKSISVGYMLRIDCWGAEKDLKTTYGSECALTSLAVDEPLEYARLYLEGNLQMWVDAEDSLEL